MSVFNDPSRVISRKIRQCAWCYQRIPTGDQHIHFVGKWEGEFQDWRMHVECFGVYSIDWGEFMPGENERPKAVEVKGRP